MVDQVKAADLLTEVDTVTEGNGPTTDGEATATEDIREIPEIFEGGDQDLGQDLQEEGGVTPGPLLGPEAGLQEDVHHQEANLAHHPQTGLQPNGLALDLNPGPQQGADHQHAVLHQQNHDHVLQHSECLAVATHLVPSDEILTS